MNDFTLVFYKKANGDCPVVEFMRSLNKEMLYKMMQKLDYLELYGNHPKGDFTKPVGDGLFEVRAQNKTDITRIFFFFDKNKQIVLTNGFVKKTQRMPSAEMDTAIRYRADYLARGQERDAVIPKVVEKEKVYVGPKWRREFDGILVNAQKRSADSERKKDLDAQAYGKNGKKGYWPEPHGK